MFLRGKKGEWEGMERRKRGRERSREGEREVGRKKGRKEKFYGSCFFAIVKNK